MAALCSSIDISNSSGSTANARACWMSQSQHTYVRKEVPNIPAAFNGLHLVLLVGFEEPDHTYVVSWHSVIAILTCRPILWDVISSSWTSWIFQMCLNRRRTGTFWCIIEICVSYFSVTNNVGKRIFAEQLAPNCSCRPGLYLCVVCRASQALALSCRWLTRVAGVGMLYFHSFHAGIETVGPPGV